MELLLVRESNTTSRVYEDFCLTYEISTVPVVHVESGRYLRNLCKLYILAIYTPDGHFAFHFWSRNLVLQARLSRSLPVSEKVNGRNRRRGTERVWAAWFARLLEIEIVSDKTYTFCLDSAVAGFFPALLISAVK